MPKYARLLAGLLPALLSFSALAVTPEPGLPEASEAMEVIQPLPQPVKMSFCIFDLEGEKGDIATFAKDVALDARAWNLFVNVKVYTNERVLAEDFKAGQCDGAAMSTLRAKQFNNIVGSIDAPGNLPDYEALKLLLKTLSSPQIASLGINGRYQVVGVVPIGAVFVMVNDRSINSIDKAAGKRVIVLDWDPTQAKMISAIGAQPVPSDLTNYSAKFNNGQADIIAAPALAYQPLELYKGIGNKGGIIRFPLLQATGTILIRRDFMLPKIPDLDIRLRQLRQFGLNHLDQIIRVFQRAEDTIPKNLWINLAPQDAVKYNRMLREARIHLTQQGVYNPVMMHILKQVRCKQEPSNAECSTFDE